MEEERLRELLHRLLEAYQLPPQEAKLLLERILAALQGAAPEKDQTQIKKEHEHGIYP